MLKNILDSCKYVVKNSKYVKINNQKLEEAAKSLDSKNCSHWLSTSPFGLLDFDIREIVNFLLVYHGIGFSYWGNPKWTITTSDGKLDGAYAMMYLLIQQMKNNRDFLDPTHLQNISKEEFYDLLTGNIEIPLFEQRYSNITSIGKSINENMDGDFYNCIKDIVNDHELFDFIIHHFDIFNDVSSKNGKSIYLYKLTQLIDNEQEITKDSDYEIEIRAHTIVAINEISKSRKDICPIKVNDLIWLMGQEKNSNRKPYHLTRSRFY